jgi:hypothetical protein
MISKRIKGYRNFYIHPEGYVYKIYNQREMIIPIKIVKTVPKISIGSTSYNFVFLMIEYFGDQIIRYNEHSQFRFKFKMIDGKIPYSSIKLIKYNSNKHDDIRVFRFKCLEKSISANGRVSNISTISEGDVFDSLLRTDFKCSYCNRNLDHKTWELDHVNPLSKTGLNISTNIAPSCKNCNRMKSNMDLMDFIHTCKLISMNFSDSEFLNEECFKNKTI